MKKITIMAAAGAALLAACMGQSEAEKAVREYDIVAKQGTNAEKCAAAGKAAEAWLGEQNEAQYQQWKRTRDIYCLAAEFGK
jgi:hypothetical protein